MNISNKLNMKHPIPNNLDDVERQAVQQLSAYSVDQELIPEDFMGDSVQISTNNWRLLSNNEEWFTYWHLPDPQTDTHDYSQNTYFSHPKRYDKQKYLL